MAELFQTSMANMTLHISNIFKENELDRISVCKDYLLTALDGKNYKTKFYRAQQSFPQYSGGNPGPHLSFPHSSGGNPGIIKTWMPDR